MRVWDNWEYELVIPGCPTLARRVNVGHPGIKFSFYHNAKNNA